MQVALANSVFMAGMLSAFLVGLLGDRFGRKKVIVASTLAFGVFQLSGAFMPGYASYTLTRFLTAFSESCAKMHGLHDHRSSSLSI